MSSSGVIRLCPPCRAGYILSSDLHVICKGCLEVEHAGQAMTPQASCPSCKLLSLKEKQRRLAIFSSGKDASQLRKSYPPDKLLDFFNARQDLDISSSDGEMASSHAPSCMRLETEPLWTGGFPGHPDVSQHPPHGDWCARSQSAGDYPEGSESEQPDCAGTTSAFASKRLGGKVHRSALRSPGSSLALVSGSVSLPLEFSHPTSEAECAALHLRTITKVLADKGFPTVPPLEPSLSSIFGVGVAWYDVPSLHPPCSDRLTTRLTDRVHPCLFMCMKESTEAREVLWLCWTPPDGDCSPLSLICDGHLKL